VIKRAAILSTGDELTTGRIADTNAQWIADKLFELGIDVVTVVTVGDYPERLEWAWRQALSQADVVVSTGGIGPTADDLTTETVGAVLGRKLVEDGPSADRMRKFFASRGVDMPLNNLKQAMVPEGYVIVPNPLGTAPGYRVQAGGKHIVVLPGVPREMKPMVEDTVLPWLRAQQGSDVYLAHTFQTFGISESGLDELVAGIVSPSEGRVSFRASFPEVSVRVVVRGQPDEAGARLEGVAARMREKLGEYCYGEGAVTMEAVVGQALEARGWRLGLAESCTGGLVSHRITAIPGSSAYFLGGVEAYANSAKTNLLGVSRDTLQTHGAVSEECAGEMAAGALRAFGADVAVSTTGIAGPDGGTPEKPVGYVCFGLATADGVVTRTHQLWGTRDWVKLLASQVALDMVRRTTLRLPLWDPSLFRRR
jgi:nicotinamide-nucleotide amidase